MGLTGPGPHFPLPLSLMFGFSELRPSNGGVTLSAKTGFFWPETLLRGKNFFFQNPDHTSITAVTTGINFFCRGGHGREENLKNLTAVKFCIDHGREIFPRFLLVSSFSFVDRARPPFPSLPSQSWGGKSNIKSAKKKLAPLRLGS